jgi:hypothetical protein
MVFGALEQIGRANETKHETYHVEAGLLDWTVGSWCEEADKEAFKPHARS